MRRALQEEMPSKPKFQNAFIMSRLVSFVFSMSASLYLFPPDDSCREIKECFCQNYFTKKGRTNGRRIAKIFRSLSQSLRTFAIVDDVSRSIDCDNSLKFFLSFALRNIQSFRWNIFTMSRTELSSSSLRLVQWIRKIFLFKRIRIVQEEILKLRFLYLM